MANNTSEILADLIAIPSYVTRDNNEKLLAEFIEKYFSEKTTYPLLHKQQVEDGRFNLIFAKSNSPKLCFFGHMDTVLPQKDNDRSFNPKAIDGNMYGLGAVDMKAGLAIMLAIASEFENDALGFVFSVDEEYEFKGAKKLQEIRDFLPRTIINIEPTDNLIINGCRGVTEFTFSVHGKSVHAGRKDLGRNAIEKTVELVNVLEKKLQELDSDLTTSVNLAYLHGGIRNESPEGIEITGSGNVVPNYAEVICEIRIGNDKISQQMVENLIIDIAQKLEIRIENIQFKFFVGMMFTPRESLSSFEKAISQSGLKSEFGSINESGYYEVQMLQETWKSDCIVFGPGPRDTSHTAEEHVDLSSLELSEKVLRQFIAITLESN